MSLKYHDLPFGAQLLLWTSRVFFHGSCRTKPSKYDLVDIAFSKVGIDKGPVLLKKFLYILKFENKVHLQPICIQDITESEINLIDCIEDHKKNNFNNNSNLSLEEAYKILNLDKNKKLTKDDVKKAHANIQKKIHPDISPETSRLSAIVNEAKEVILKTLS